MAKIGKYTRTKAIRKRQSLSNKQAWLDPDIRAKYMANRAWKGKGNPKAIKAMHKAVKELWKNPEFKKHMSKALSRALAGKKHTIKDPIAYSKMRSRAGMGRVHSLGTKKRMSIARRKQPPISEKIKQKMSATHRANWQNPEYAKRVLLAQKRVPNRCEIHLNEILSKNFRKEWRYVGNGEVVIGGKNPDFININGKKQVIELFGNYWHNEENPQGRISVFKKYGFDTLIIWENELSNENTVIKRVTNFQSRKQGKVKNAV